MALLLKDRDYALNEAGELATVTGAEALLGEVLFRLTARRESFPFLPELGSRLYLLRGEKPGQWESLALQYAVGALNGLDLAVTGVSARQEGDRLWLSFELIWQGLPLQVECEA